MNTNGFGSPTALSRLGQEGDSRSAQSLRAIRWLEAQPGGPIVVVTPQKRLDSEIIEEFVRSPEMSHVSWKGMSPGVLTGHRVLHAWPRREHLNDLWGVDVDALAVIEWSDLDEWILDARPSLLLPGQTMHPGKDSQPQDVPSVPADVSGILTYLAGMASGYNSGLKWDETHKLKADLMNTPNRWQGVTPDEVRKECRRLGMRPADTDTVVELVARRKQGRRFNLARSSYKDFAFQPATELKSAP